MTTLHTGEKAKYGVYLCGWPLDLRFVGADGEALDGRRGLTYRRIPTLLLLALAPVLGGVFVLAFPALVLALALAAVGRRLWRSATGLAEDKAHLVVLNWDPQAAYLHGPGEGQKRDDTATTPQAQAGLPESVAQLREEVDRRRQRES